MNESCVQLASRKWMSDIHTRLRVTRMNVTNVTSGVTQMHGDMGWLPLVGSLKLEVSLAKEPYKRKDILHKRPII